jgi:NAD-specific glutamate dehydrogenase
MQAFQSIQNILGNSITRFIRTGIKSKLPPEIHELLATVPLWMTDKQQQAYADSVALWQDFPKPLAEKLQQLSLIPDVLMIHHLANTANKPAEVQGPLYFQASEAFAFGNLQDVLSKVKCHTDWQESMLVHLSCDAVAIQAQLILSDDGLEQWQEKYATIIPRIQALQPEMDLAYFSFIINQLKEHLRVDVG